MIVVDITVALTTFGITVAYLGIAADILPACVEQLAPSVDAGSILRNSYFWLILCWGVLAAPLSMLRSVGFLGYTSAIAVRISCQHPIRCVAWPPCRYCRQGHG